MNAEKIINEILNNDNKGNIKLISKNPFINHNRRAEFRVIIEYPNNEYKVIELSCPIIVKDEDDKSIINILSNNIKFDKAMSFDNYKTAYDYVDGFLTLLNNKHKTKADIEDIEKAKKSIIKYINNFNRKKIDYYTYERPETKYIR